MKSKTCKRLLLQLDFLIRMRHYLYHYFIPEMIIFEPLRLDKERLFCFYFLIQNARMYISIIHKHVYIHVNISIIKHVEETVRGLSLSVSIDCWDWLQHSLRLIRVTKSELIDNGWLDGFFKYIRILKHLPVNFE